MDYCTPQSTRRHNPVDSICRKLQTIQWRGDREPNSPFQIPKLSSSNYDSPQCDLRHNLEDILKKRAVHGEKGDREREQGRGKGMLASTASSRNSLGPSVPPSTPSCPFTPASNPTNVTYTITSTLGERRGAGCGSSSGPGQAKTWQKYCSTPSSQAKDSPYFTFTQKAPCTQPESERQSTSPPLRRSDSQGHSMLSYNLNFCSADLENTMECELPYPALVVKRLSMGDGGSTLASDSRRENMAEVSLICEEDLLDTIFHACDTQRRGKVYVSRIVDYLRHTTSRSSEDSGLEELCNMLDPEHKDVSIDLDTYHAIMKEWIDDCRNNGYWENFDIWFKLRDSLSAKRSMLLNMTSGSLEAFGGEASRADETSELVYCVADLQMSNQKLQEEVRKLKQVVEGMEESNQKLAEENEELRNQARVNQQLVQKEKLLKEEVEEMKATLSYTEEGRTRASAHSKHMERENQSLIAKIASLQEENFKITMETEELQRRMVELCDMNTDLQVASLSLKHHFCLCLFGPAFVYLRLHLPLSDKSKLENQMQMMHPEVTGTGLSLSVAYRLNQTSSGSLQTELALAQSPMETLHTVDHLSSTMTFASPLDETLDREVLLLLQGPSPEHMALEFRSLLSKLKRDFREETVSVLSSVRSLLDNDGQPEGSADSSLQAELDARRADWAVSLDQLAQYADSLEKELIKMASNMRRSRTEILHLSVRVQEQENQKRQLCEELEQLRTPQDSREASCQTPEPEQEVRHGGRRGQDARFKGFVWSGLASEKSNMGNEDSERKEGLLTPKGEHEGKQGEGVTFMWTLQELSRSMEAIEEHKVQEDLSETSMTTEKESMFGFSMRHCNSYDDHFSLDTEFQRLSLGFKCDMFTLEKRLRLEERSRDLAEENVRREVSSCQGLLQALIPLCEDDNQSMEIIQRLQKNLDILIQSMTRVSSRSEMLGAIHQESRIGKAVEVMIQHVENLRRMYTKEHAELLELREALMQNERSFGSQTERASSPTVSDPVMTPSLSQSLTSSRAAAAAAVARGGRGLWLWLAMVVVLAGLLALLASLVMQPAVDAAPVGTGDSWMTIQQLLWPYTGLRHNGQPPV
uniref:Lymphoid-restricted membrane protein n=1 Tax=Myripristis murdjan TaxID=586833 RepID=A0A668AIV7_9TELE